MDGSDHFSSTISVLVNESLTKDFRIERGLRQGYPMSLFLFVLTAKGLAYLINKDAYIGEFEGFCYDVFVKNIIL